MAKRYTQPQGNATIDWANPITRGLLGAFLPNSGINLADGTALQTISPTATGINKTGVSITTGSVGVPCPASSVSPYAKFDLNVLSALAIVVQSSAQNGNLSFFRGNGSSAPGWGVGLHGGSLNGPYISIGSWIASPAVDLGSGWTLSPRVVLLVADGMTGVCWADGKVVGSSTYSAASYQYDTLNQRQVFFGDKSGTIADQTVAPSLGLFWNRALSAAEAKSISANPWQIFRGNTLILPAASVTLPTIGRPATDGPTGAWTATGGTGTLASAIGELTAIDTDYISVNSASTYTGTLNACAYPGGATQTVSFRGSSSAGSSVTLTFVQSGVTLLSWTQVLTGTVTTYTHNLTTLTGDATAITFTIASS